MSNRVHYRIVINTMGPRVKKINKRFTHSFIPDDEAEGGPRVPHPRQQVDPLRGHPSQLTLIYMKKNPYVHQQLKAVFRIRIRILLSSCKNSKKNLDSYRAVLRLLLDILSLDPDPHSDPGPFVRGMDPRIRIRIHTKMSWIRNTGWKGKIYFDTAAPPTLQPVLRIRAILVQILIRASG